MPVYLIKVKVWSDVTIAGRTNEQMTNKERKSYSANGPWMDVLFPSRISKEQDSIKTYENTSNFLKSMIVFLDMNMYPRIFINEIYL